MRTFVVLAVAASVGTFAMTPWPMAVASERDAPRAEAARVTKHLRSLGYSAISGIDVQGDRFVVDAVNPSGRDVDVLLDRRTLRVIRENRS